MRLWKHLLAHKTAPLYAFCEWYVFGRDKNWEDDPAPIIENVLTRKCAHMTASSAGLHMTCGECGTMPVVSVGHSER